MKKPRGAISKAEFSAKVGISLKEMRESNYWIKLIIEITKNPHDWLSLKQESFELMNILGSIYSKTSIKR